jgi:3-oxoacyl-[acyl-carrier-protein] synthase III
MSIFTLKGVKIAGIAACVPSNEVHNIDYKWIPEKERFLLMRTTGVISRRVAPKGVTTSDLCIKAGEKLINELGWDKNEIGLCVFISQSRDYPIPATAIIVQDRMNLPRTCMAYDINMGCSGYVYGLSTVASTMIACGVKKALLMVGDISTANISYKDKSAYPLFGDAGCTTALELSDDSFPMHFNLQSDGSGFNAIIIPDGGMKNLIGKKSFEYKKISDGIYRHKVQLALDGIKIFNFALKEVTPNINTLLEYCNKNLNDVDYLILHQANLLINETIRKKLKILPEKVPHSIDRYGNTSSASIPLTMITELREKLLKEELAFMLSGFGVGLSWGSVWLKTEKIICPEVIEY